MNRRELLKKSAMLGLAAETSAFGTREIFAAQGPVSSNGHDQTTGRLSRLSAPARGAIPVAFVLSDGAVVIDFCGPWEVFQDARTEERNQLFSLYTVAETLQPVKASAGLKIVPDFTFQTAPPPKVVVIPAQDGDTAAMLDWIRASSKAADVTMSVCTGAFVLAKTGLLSGKTATTHHSAYKEFAMAFPDVQLKRGARFVEDGNLASSGGLSSGMDLALRVVQRYYGREQAERTADLMEYQGQGWLNPDSNQAYAKIPVSTDEHPLCPVCSMQVNHTWKSTYKDKAYYFCSKEHKQLFEQSPAQFVEAPQHH